MRQFLKETGLHTPYRNAYVKNIAPLFKTNPSSDPLALAVQKVAHYYCKKVIGEVSRLSLFIREMIGGLHTGDDQ